MKDLVVEGNIFHNGRMVQGRYSIRDDAFVEDSRRPSIKGTLLKGPVNFHTHLGDSFISEEPIGDIPSIVGPSGFKINKLNAAAIQEIRQGMKRSIEFMKSVGTAAFFDFRESGLRGIKSIPSFERIGGFFLTRPNDSSEISDLLESSAGFGFSSVSDYDESFLVKSSNASHKHGKIFAIHFSENEREDVRSLLRLKPEFVVHCIEASDDDIKAIRDHGIPIVLTPRSNIFHGKRPNYRKLFDSGAEILIGTDNVFIAEPDVMEEASFLFQYQHGLARVSPDSIISAVTETPRTVMRKFGLVTDEETYILYGEKLSSYQILTRPHLYAKLVIKKRGKRINFFPRINSAKEVEIRWPATSS
ncbi:MAG: amidohydrolase family protein [Thermoplasmata archaeon]